MKTIFEKEVKKFERQVRFSLNLFFRLWLFKSIRNRDHSKLFIDLKYQFRIQKNKLELFFFIFLKRTSLVNLNFQITFRKMKISYS